MSATTTMIQTFHGIVMAGLPMTKRHILSSKGIPQERVHSIIRETLAMKKASARWTPKLLTSDHKGSRHNMSRNKLALFEADA